ncbi:PREDICTED: uncharacterized protein LOC103606130, partial [Galeopterus variegatus]|uniref:Uncharacterized protein LOC103606130 n=1 Tax=Galeopterus variegatus TaxID=482537 RepID=A0ABM0S7V2_GALVR
RRQQRPKGELWSHRTWIQSQAGLPPSVSPNELRPKCSLTTCEKRSAESLPARKGHQGATSSRVRAPHPDGAAPQPHWSGRPWRRRLSPGEQGRWGGDLGVRGGPLRTPTLSSCSRARLRAGRDPGGRDGPTQSLGAQARSLLLLQIPRSLHSPRQGWTGSGRSGPCSPQQSPHAMSSGGRHRKSPDIRKSACGRSRGHGLCPQHLQLTPRAVRMRHPCHVFPCDVTGGSLLLEKTAQRPCSRKRRKPVPPPLLLLGNPGELPPPPKIPLSSITANASAHMTWQLTLDPGVEDMDTTPTSTAVIFVLQVVLPEGLKPLRNHSSFICGSQELEENKTKQKSYVSNTFHFLKRTHLVGRYSNFMYYSWLASLICYTPRIDSSPRNLLILTNDFHLQKPETSFLWICGYIYSHCELVFLAKNNAADDNDDNAAADDNRRDNDHSDDDDDDDSDNNNHGQLMGDVKLLKEVHVTPGDGSISDS